MSGASVLIGVEIPVRPRLAVGLPRAAQQQPIRPISPSGYFTPGYGTLQSGYAAIYPAGASFPLPVVSLTFSWVLSGGTLARLLAIIGGTAYYRVVCLLSIDQTYRVLKLWSLMVETHPTRRDAVKAYATIIHISFRYSILLIQAA